MTIRKKEVVKYRDEEHKVPLVLYEIIVDKVGELPTNPVVEGEEIAQGSRCWVIESAVWYGYTSTGKWINQKDGGAVPVLIEKTISENGTYNAADDDADGYSSVTVDVSGGGNIGLPILATPASIATIVNEAICYIIPQLPGLGRVDISHLYSYASAPGVTQRYVILPSVNSAIRIPYSTEFQENIKILFTPSSNNISVTFKSNSQSAYTDVAGLSSADFSKGKTYLISLKTDIDDSTGTLSVRSVSIEEYEEAISFTIE